MLTQVNRTTRGGPQINGGLALERRLVEFVGLVLLITNGGCATHISRVHEAHQAFFAGDLDRSITLLDLAAQEAERGRDCALLDRAMVQLVAGKTGEAEQALRGVRDRFDHLQETSAAEQGLSWITDDNAIAYAGEDYEKVLIHAFLALADLMHNGGDARAYCLQMDQKQRSIVESGGANDEENPKLAYQQVAFGAYLRGVLHEASHLNYDDAERCYALAASWEPDFRAVQYDFVRARSGVHSQQGNGVVYVFAMVGRGPHKDTTVVEASSSALAIAEALLYANGNRELPPIVPPIVPPIEVPQIVVPQNVVDSINVTVDGSVVGQTQTVTDVGRMAVMQHDAVFDQVVARAVARRAFKLTTTMVAKEALNVEEDDTWASLALDLLGLLWESSERADTQAWGLLPEKIQVQRIELPAGEHQITLSASKLGHVVGPDFSRQVTVVNGRDTYVLACFPDRQLVGQILTSSEGQVSRLSTSSTALDVR
ncbi:MAG: hypothetical protein CMJ50_03015 [Planctomycetaceae bacterium]|nr:hypothetical protein [Planctomycetaceae bacterium]